MPLKNMCYYINCGKHRLKDNGISYFKFPIKEKQRAIEWQKRCGNIEIALMDVEELKETKLCERHFLKSDILINSRRKTLRRNALPVAYNSDGK